MNTNTKESAPETKTRLECALEMARRGFKIFPVVAGGKTPLLPGDWRAHATKDEAKIRHWFKELAGMNYAVMAGAGYIVVDLDVKGETDGVKKFDLLQLEHGFVETFVVVTPSGGKHLYLRVRGTFGNSHSFGDGIDVRGGTSGYVVGPGCEVDGKRYTVANDTEIADADDWIVERLGKANVKDENSQEPLVKLDQPSAISQAREYLKVREPSIEGKGDGGDIYTFLTFCELKDLGISEAKSVELVTEPLFEDGQSWNDKCEGPWDVAGKNSLTEKARNAYRYGTNQPGDKASILMDDPEFAIPVEEMDATVAWFEARRKSKPKLVVDNEQQQEKEDLFTSYMESELDQIPEPAWLIRDILPEASLCMTYGATGSLKTFLELDKALWGATGKPWGEGKMRVLEGYKVARPLRTAFVAGEGARGLKRRIRAWKKRHDVTEDLAVLVIPEMPRFAVRADVEKLVRTIEAKLGGADLVIVDTAMRAAAGLNLSLPADSQILLDAFDRVRRSLGCTVTFVHHTGKDRERGALGAENLLAGVDMADLVELKETSQGPRVIKITNKKMKDEDKRPPIYMDATRENLGNDVDNRPVSSLVLDRCHEVVKGDSDTRLAHALEIIEENAGKMPLSMSELAEMMARRYANEELSDGELARSKESMRKFLSVEVKDRLAPYAHKDSDAKKAQWIFEDRSGRKRRNEN